MRTKVRITKKLLAQVPKKIRDDYLYWRECMSEDYRRYGSPGLEVDAEYKKIRAKVIEILAEKKLI